MKEVNLQKAWNEAMLECNGYVYELPEIEYTEIDSCPCGHLVLCDCGEYGFKLLNNIQNCNCEK